MGSKPTHRCMCTQGFIKLNNELLIAYESFGNISTLNVLRQRPDLASLTISYDHQVDFKETTYPKIWATGIYCIYRFTCKTVLGCYN